MKTILIVEDDKSLSNGITLTLKSDDREFIQCPDIKSAGGALREKTPDLIILDVNLPDGNGFDFCRELRREVDVPVLFLTAKDTEIDEVYGFEVGGNDYITKPFSLAVLRARTEALLRDRIESDTIFSDYRNNQYDFDFKNMNFYVRNNQVELSKTEQKLLYILITNRNNIVKRDRLMEYVWNGSDEFVYENSLSVVVRRLREKLEDVPSEPKYIKTVFGVGYMWVDDDE